MKSFFIYYLLDPRTNETRYVGYTSDIEKRMYSHLADTTDTYKVRWLQSIRPLPPILSIKCIVSGVDEAKRIEIALIAKLREFGIRLTNSTSGGDGTPGIKHSEEQREKARLAWTPEKRLAASLRQKARKLSEETRHKISLAGKGQKRNATTRLRISLAAKGKPKSADHRLKISARQISFETKSKMVDAAKKRWQRGDFDSVSLMRGKQHTLETKLKMSCSQLRRRLQEAEAK